MAMASISSSHWGAEVAALARAAARAVVIENVIDFAGEQDMVLVFVLKRHLPAGCGQAAALARILEPRAQDNPEPNLGAHRPKTS
jgi:hypothetical protein